MKGSFLPGTRVIVRRKQPQYDKDYPDEYGEIVEVNGKTAFVSTVKCKRGLRCYVREDSTGQVFECFAANVYRAKTCGKIACNHQPCAKKRVEFKRALRRSMQEVPCSCELGARELKFTPCNLHLVAPAMLTALETILFRLSDEPMGDEELREFCHAAISKIKGKDVK